MGTIIIVRRYSYRASGLNLVTAAIVLWNTVYLERAVNSLRNHQSVDDALLQYLSPLGWEHINLTGKAYGALEVLKGIDLSVSRGQIIAIIGPSGSGKSTLLCSINHLEVLNDGEIWLEGEQVNRPLKGRAFEKHINAVRQQMGMVFTNEPDHS